MRNLGFMHGDSKSDRAFSHFSDIFSASYACIVTAKSN